MRDLHHNQRVRQQLDAVRPDSADLTDTGLRDAANAVASSEEWSDLFAQQQKIDCLLAEIVQDVDPPEGFQGRLLARLAADRQSTAHPLPQASSSSALSQTRTPGSRTRFHNQRRYGPLVTAMASLAACLALGLYLWNSGSAQLTLNEIRHKLPLADDSRIDLSVLPRFDGSFVLAQPTGRWEQLIMDEPVGLDWSGDGRHDAALLAFQSRTTPRIAGYLLVVPAAAVSDPPTQRLFSAAGINYFPTENAPCMNAGGDLVYLCFVEPGRLDDLQRLLYPHSA